MRSPCIGVLLFPLRTRAQEGWAPAYMRLGKAARYSSGARDYPEVARAAVLEMHRQVNDLETDNQGFALRGLMIRHLVMPNRVAGTKEFVQWVAENLPLSTYVNIMAQYRVEYKAYDY